MHVRATLQGLALLSGLGAPAWSQAPVQEIQLPTAEGEQVTYRFDLAQKKPLGAEDDRAAVTEVSLVVLPKKAGEPMRLAFAHALRFKPGQTPQAITVQAVNSGKPVATVVEDKAPVVQDSLWKGHSAPVELDKAMFSAMTAKDPWILQRKFVITYSDGTRRVLHQLAVITNPMRFKLLETATGLSLTARP